MWELARSSLESMQQHQLATRCFIKETLKEWGIVMMFNVDLFCESTCLNLVQPVRISLVKEIRKD